jgi:putative acetyltransferase
MDDTTSSALTIRAERPADHDEIAEVVAAAFKSQVEAQLVADLRASRDFVPEWSLVATRDERIVGHVMVTYAMLDDGESTRRIANLSPLAVAPDVHSQGIGSALVRAVAARVDEAGEPFIVIEGAPAYYGRFGFEHSVRHDIHIDLPDWAPAEAAQVLRLRNDDPTIRGRVVYPPAFHAFEP